MLVTAVVQPKTPPRVLHMRSLLVLERLKTTIDNVNNLVDVARWEYQFQPKLILNRKPPALRITAPVLAQYTANGNRKRKCLNLEMLK